MAELGPMRFPLASHPYLNNLIRERYKLNISDFSNFDDHAYTYINGILVTNKEANENPDIFQFNRTENERGKTPGQLTSEAFRHAYETYLTGGWSEVLKQWDSYSFQSYLYKMNLSRAAVDFAAVSGNYETDLFTSIMGSIRNTIVFSAGSALYRISGGNDLLAESMVNECKTIESNRCSILYSSPISDVKLMESNKIQLSLDNGTSQMFDIAIVATPPTVTQFFNFEPRSLFIQKYLALRRVQYNCASKIFLFFNVSLWYTQENIRGGSSTTDLPIRSIYYPSTTSNQTDGGTVLASYTRSQNSMIWQSLSESDAIELALKQLIQIHRNSSNMRNYFQGGKVKHWCQDPFVRGSFASFIPFQETELVDPLQASISNIHFIGEYTSLFHGWIEGALSSAVRTAHAIGLETTFDVVIIGGGPIGVITAINLSQKQTNLRIAIIEKGTILNSYDSSSSFDQRQFRQIYNEIYLAELANMSIPLWRQLEQTANMSIGSILNTDNGFLFFGDFNTNQTTVDGDFISMKNTCEHLRLGCEYLNSTQLKIRYSAFTFPTHYQGIFHSHSGYINVKALFIALRRIISLNPNIVIRENEEFISLKLDNQTQIITDRGTLYASQKVLFVPGSYAKNISDLFNFYLNITLWEIPIYHFRLLSNSTQIPTWLSWDGHDLQSLFTGFTSSLSSTDYITLLPRFIKDFSKPLMYPSQKKNIIDTFLTQKVIAWVSRYMTTEVNVSDYYWSSTTCLATFLSDNGFLLDYIPGTNRKALIQAGGWGMEFAPVWGDILSDVILLDQATNTSSKYSKYMQYFSLSRFNRTDENIVLPNEGLQTVPAYIIIIVLLLSNYLKIF
ncbi:unnamed protein product [Rotaria sp. Silwood2]|nr:unnamed protein product [Rotaria sp. Silwood2]CAF4332079.1 unnamed protein product [Rotaria sp. Silwood2]